MFYKFHLALFMHILYTVQLYNYGNYFAAPTDSYETCPMYISLVQYSAGIFICLPDMKYLCFCSSVIVPFLQHSLLECLRSLCSSVKTSVHLALATRRVRSS